MDDFQIKVLINRLKYLNVCDISCKKVYGSEYYYIFFLYKGVELCSNVKHKEEFKDDISAFIFEIEQEVWKTCDSSYFCLFDYEQPPERLRSLLFDLASLLFEQISFYCEISTNSNTPPNFSHIEDLVLRSPKNSTRLDIFYFVKNTYLASFK